MCTSTRAHDHAVYFHLIVQLPNMAPPTPNPPPSPPTSPPHPPPAPTNPRRDVAHIGAWTHNSQRLSTHSNEVGDMVLHKHPDISSVEGRHIAEILEEYESMGRSIAEEYLTEKTITETGDVSSSVCVEHGGSGKGV
jgi:hypothetical protein